jgi:hypothetical protein
MSSQCDIGSIPLLSGQERPYSQINKRGRSTIPVCKKRGAKCFHSAIMSGTGRPQVSSRLTAGRPNADRVTMNDPESGLRALVVHARSPPEVAG